MAERQYKSLPQFVKEISGRTVTGICAVFGNVDLGGDRLHPGAFAKTISEGKGKFKHLWNHGADGWDYFVTPPIAVIKGLREVGRDELPPAVLAFAPEAAGGLEVIREYLDTPRGNEVLAALKAGVPLEMSFGYDPIKYDWSTMAAGTSQEQRIRELREVRLWDTSDVNFGMNPATTATGKNRRRKMEGKPDGGDPDPDPPPPVDFASFAAVCPNCNAKLKVQLKPDGGDPDPDPPPPVDGYTPPKGSRAGRFDWKRSLTESRSAIEDLESD